MPVPLAEVLDRWRWTHFVLPILQLGLSLGVWYGKKAETTAYWLRWWDQGGKLWLWGSEQRQRADQLRALGVDPEV